MSSYEYQTEISKCTLIMGRDHGHHTCTCTCTKMYVGTTILIVISIPYISNTHYRDILYIHKYMYMYMYRYTCTCVHVCTVYESLVVDGHCKNTPHKFEVL